MSKTLILATGNAGKLNELQALTQHLELDIKSQAEFDVPSAEETGLSFVENAIIKARNACQCTGLPAIADDSGLEVDALQGRPGIYTARYAGPNANARQRNEKLLGELAGVPAAERTARFRCVLVYMQHALDPSPVICEGTWAGEIIDAETGDNGFGYDPVFYVPAYACTSAELPAAVKNELSHRGQAMQQLLQYLP